MQKFQTISPIDNTVYLERAYASNKEIDTALANAQKAQKGWKTTSIAERAAICNKVVEYFLNNAQEMGLELTHQMGRPIRYTPFEITKGFQERAKYMIEIAASQLADIQVPEQSGFTRFIRREPLGTVLVLAPWNYPYLTSVNAIIPAIMAGNTVILKHATQTPLCAERYAKAFDYANAPDGVFQFIHADHDQVAHIIRDKRIDYVAFTGSVKGGAAVQQAMASRFINAGLELGGKDPAYVRADVNLEHAIENVVDGAFFNSGQSCCGIERVYVHQDIFQSFVEGFVEQTKKYLLDNPLEQATTLGPMVRTSAAQIAQAQIEAAIKKGAKSLVSTDHFKNHQLATPYMAPQVLVNVDHSMELMKEETFAPVVMDQRGRKSLSNRQPTRNRNRLYESLRLSRPCPSLDGRKK